MAAETNEERQARVVAEATAKANANQRDKEIAEAKALREKNDRKVILYSTLPEFKLVLQSEETEEIKMSDGTYRDRKTTANVTLAFRGHRAWGRFGDLETIRKIHGYGIRFVEGLDAQDGDKNARSLEASFDKDDMQAHTFCKQLEHNSTKTNMFVKVDEYVVRKELRKMREAMTVAK